MLGADVVNCNGVLIFVQPISLFVLAMTVLQTLLCLQLPLHDHKQDVPHTLCIQDVRLDKQDVSDNSLLPCMRSFW